MYLNASDYGLWNHRQLFHLKVICHLMHVKCKSVNDVVIELKLHFSGLVDYRSWIKNKL